MTGLRPGMRSTSGAVTVALALDANDKPKRLHYYLIVRGEAVLFDITDLADAAGHPVPRELDSIAFSDAWATRLFAVACYVARIGPERIAAPAQRALPL